MVPVLKCLYSAGIVKEEREREKVIMRKGKWRRKVRTHGQVVPKFTVVEAMPMAPMYPCFSCRRDFTKDGGTHRMFTKRNKR